MSILNCSYDGKGDGQFDLLVPYATSFLATITLDTQLVGASWLGSHENFQYKSSVVL